MVMLMEKCIEIFEVLSSTDNVCRKYVQKTKDNYRIETTYVDYRNKHIICFSTQIGCNLKCQFCYNGLKHNFRRNLTEQEIITQIENVMEKENVNNKPILFSAMGIGEPLLNYDNLIKSFCYLNSKYPNNKFALATTGVNLKNILNLVEDLKDINSFKLTISLHSANQDKRNSIMPIENSIDSLVKTVKQYERESKREVEWNYVLFAEINDSKEDAEKLFKLLGKDEYIKINRFNKVDISELKESNQTEMFISELKKYGMQVEYYETNGSDINGACGQMISD